MPLSRLPNPGAGVNVLFHSVLVHIPVVSNPVVQAGDSQQCTVKGTYEAMRYLLCLPL